jgi:hypothetical protein
MSTEDNLRSEPNQEKPPRARRRFWPWFSLAFAVLTTVVATGLGLAWNGTASTYSELRSKVRAIEADAAAAQDGARADQAEAESARTRGEAARSKYTSLREELQSRIRAARRGGFNHGFDAGQDAVFLGYDVAWDRGNWYVVWIGMEGGHLSLATRSDIDPDSGTAYSVDGGEIYTHSTPDYANPSTLLGDFCDTHDCIPNFENGNGYPVQCADGSWSQSGGLQGACSWHGGVG